MALRAVLGLAALALVAGPAPARPDGNPDFGFTCALGPKQVRITTEQRRLVYRYGTRRRTELTIVEQPERRNVLYRYELYSRSNLQQLRFRNAGHDYILYSYFSAADYSGRGFADEGGLIVMSGTKILSRRRCRGGGFDEDHRLDSRPADPDPIEMPASG